MSRILHQLHDEHAILAKPTFPTPTSFNTRTASLPPLKLIPYFELFRDTMSFKQAPNNT